MQGGELLRQVTQGLLRCALGCKGAAFQALNTDVAYAGWLRLCRAKAWRLRVRIICIPMKYH
jgi:hypothetical protein